ncbi:MAG: phosphotransferase [Deltaproteobacteria bacterium]|nr:phosphotransferase [Deltaproteobacteria bacterium]
MSRSRSSGERDASIADLVSAEFGVEVSRIDPLRGALGCRNFSRVWLERAETERDSIPGTLIARIEASEDPGGRPAGIPPEPPLEPIRALLEREGLPVPRRYAADPGRGVELLEDLGDLSLQDLARSASESELEDLYAEACALPPRLQRIEPRDSIANFQRRLDAAHFHYKAERFAQWSLAGDRGASAAENAVVRGAFDRIARLVREAPQRLAHRDFQSANLHVVEPSLRHADQTARQPRARLVMIDLQGAFMAPPEYDLVCLLRDSYVELADAAVDVHLAQARTALPDPPDEELFQLRFDLLTITRKAKDHALFRSVAAERGDDRYLQYLPATRRYLQKASNRVSSKHKEYGDLNDLIQAIPELS